MNNKKPLFKPTRTTLVWAPKNVDSEIISLNQKNAEILRTKRPNKKKYPPNEIRCT